MKKYLLTVLTFIVVVGSIIPAQAQTAEKIHTMYINSEWTSLTQIDISTYQNLDIEYRYWQVLFHGIRDNERVISETSNLDWEIHRNDFRTAALQSENRYVELLSFTTEVILTSPTIYIDYQIDKRTRILFHNFCSRMYDSMLQTNDFSTAGSIYDSCKSAGIPPISPIYKAIYTDNSNRPLSILLEWIESQVYYSDVSIEYTIPYFSFIRWNSRTAAEKNQIIEAVQTVAFSNVNEKVSNEHLKLVTKLSMMGE